MFSRLFLAVAGRVPATHETEHMPFQFSWVPGTRACPRAARSADPWGRVQTSEWMICGDDLRCQGASGAGAFEHDLDAAVLRAALRRVVAGDWMRVAEAFGRDDVGVDAL